MPDPPVFLKLTREIYIGVYVYMHRGSETSPTDLEHARKTVEIHLPENGRDRPRKERDGSRHSRNGKEERAALFR